MYSCLRKIAWGGLDPGKRERELQRRIIRGLSVHILYQVCSRDVCAFYAGKAPYRTARIGSRGAAGLYKKYDLVILV